MGNFRLEIEMIGGHGCERNVKDGEKFTGCGSINCPDCFSKEIINFLGTKYSLVNAQLIHWPKTASEVVDEFVIEPGINKTFARIRHGNF